MATIVEYVLIGFALLLLASVFASKITDRFGVPALLLFLAVGMLAGSDGPGGIYFDDPNIDQFVGVVALALILFYGGLDTDWQSVRPLLKYGVTLSTLGVFLTALILGVFAKILLGLTFLEGLLLAGCLMFIARPVSVLVCLLLVRALNKREKALVSWVGLRGAVPIVLATYPLVAKIPQAELIFNVVFFIG